MISGWLLILVSIAYLLVLFGIAHWGDNTAYGKRLASHPLVYALSLAVYCSSWTFYGAVGRASTTGWEFMATYIGPMLVFLLGWKVVEKIIAVSKQQNITSISDFIASRYGKSQGLAILVTLIAVMGTIPYIALQLKAVAISFSAISSKDSLALASGSDTALFIMLLMVVFGILFGTRQIDATEHHPGMVIAIAFESIIKLLAFSFVGLFVIFFSMGGIESAMQAVSKELVQTERFGSLFSGSFLTETLLACAAIICLPRQFHMTVVEHTSKSGFTMARWVFPLYLLILGAFVLPIAVAGMQSFAGQGINADSYVLLLPKEAGWESLAIFAFIGGLSAATSMAIVASIALATMVSNDIFMPLYLKYKKKTIGHISNPVATLLAVRRLTIFLLMFLAYVYYRVFGDSGMLASFGLLAFVAAAQFLPAILGGIYWKRGNRFGVIAGLSVGFMLWMYTLLLPKLLESQTGALLTVESPYDWHPWLNPVALLGWSGMDALTHGFLWSFGVNVLLYVCVSLWTSSRLIDRIQSAAYVDVYHSDLSEQSKRFGQVTVGDLQTLIERFLGVKRAEKAFNDFALNRNESYPLNQDTASPELIQFTERLLTGAIGASSARVLMNSSFSGKDMPIGDVVAIVDEASQVLNFSRSLLQSTIENIGLGVNVVDQKLCLVAWNQYYIDMFNFPEGFIRIGRPIEDIFAYNAERGEYGQGEKPRFIEERMQLLRERKSRSYSRQRPDGTVIQVRGNPMPNGGYVHTYMDITENKQTEQALRDSESNIRIYTDNLPVMIAYLDPQLRYLFVNKAYAEIFGMTGKNVEGLYCENLLSAKEFAYRQHYLAKVKPGMPQRFEIELPVVQQPIRFAEVTYIAHTQDDNVILGYFTLYQDITERRNAEIALKETNENLENRVRERTQALSVANKELRKENTLRSLMEDELRQAKYDAEQANIGKTRFLAAASHDLLQPLNAARLFTSALSEKNFSQDVSQLVENLDGSLRAAEELITTLLDISKLDAGALQSTPKHFSILNMFTHLSTEFKLLAEKQGLQFHDVLSDAVVYSDPVLLRRVLQNLLSNALRYTPKGKILFGVRRRGVHLSIEVWDTGVGIPDSKLDEIFEEFKRIENPRHSQVKGLGLGLAITERIASMLGHPLNVRSWQGRGSVFSIQVPLGDVQKVKAIPKERTNWSHSQGLNAVKVLVIDNEPKILEGMQALLQGWRCEVATALSTEDALTQLDQRSFVPAIMLVDYHLSDVLTGVMALEVLQEKWQKRIPAIVITADRTDEVKSDIDRIGAQLLTKPVKPAALRALMNRVLSTSA